MIGLASGVMGLAGMLTNNLVNKAASAVTTAFKAPFSNDSSEISSISQLLGKLSVNKQGMLVAGGAPVSMEDMRQILQENAAVLKDMLKQICEKNGIDTNNVFQLNMDDQGNIVINGDHPQKDKLLEVLNDSEDFKRMFKDAKAISDFIVYQDMKAAV